MYSKCDVAHYHNSELKEMTIMKDLEFIEHYNSLDQFAKDKIDRELIDLVNAKKESRNYCIKVCPKCGSANSHFTKGGKANSGKPMLQCSSCHKRFTIDHGQLTHYSHQDESKWDLLITDTFAQVPVEKTAATLDISTYTVWRMRMKLLHMFEKLLNTTVVSGEIELDEKYLLNSHKGEKIAGVEPRKRGGSASKRGLSNEQICLPTAVQRNGTAVLKATNTATPTSKDIMKLADNIGEHSMAWIDGKAAYGCLLEEKHCEKRIMKDHTCYTSIDHLNNVNAFHSLIEKWYKKYGGVASKYLNRYAALFVLVREYSGCDVQEILLSIKKRMHQITDFFRIVDMKSEDLFIY